MLRDGMLLLLALLPLLQQETEPRAVPSPQVADAGMPSGSGEGMTRPVLLPGSPPLSYSPEWLEHGRDGILIVRCTVTRGGRARDCRLIQPVEYMNEQTLR